MRVIGWILAVLIAGSTSVSAEILRFRPTDGEKNLKEVTQYRRVRSMDGVVSTSNGGSETRIRFKKTASGYVAELNLIKTWSETDGHSTAGKLGQVLVGMPVKMALDNDGRIRQIDGLGAVSKKALLMVPSASRSQFQAVFSPDVIANKMTMEWEVRMGLIRNRTLTPGMLWIATQNVNLPSGEVMTSYLVTVVLQPGNDKLIPVRTYFDT
ncbi:hypothetical protein EBR96_10895, partial [bacterium]|nr:hypothetical protein [bacterium]